MKTRKPLLFALYTILLFALCVGASAVLDEAQVFRAFTGNDVTSYLVEEKNHQNLTVGAGSPDNVTGMVGLGFEFDGSSNLHLATNTPDWVGNGPIALSLWYEVDAHTPTDWWFGGFHAATPYRWYGLVHNSPSPEVRFSDPDEITAASNQTPTGEWVHFGWIRNATGQFLYFNGTEQGTPLIGSLDLDQHLNDCMTMGSYSPSNDCSSPNFYANGRMDEVYLFNATEMDSSDFVTLASNTSDGFYPFSTPQSIIVTAIEPFNNTFNSSDLNTTFIGDNALDFTINYTLYVDGIANNTLNEQPDNTQVELSVDSEMPESQVEWVVEGCVDGNDPGVVFCSNMTGGGRQYTKDLTNVIHQLTTPENETSIFNTTTFTTDITVNNVNLNFSNYTIFNSSGDKIFTNFSDGLSGPSFQFDDVVTLQDDGTYTVELTSGDQVDQITFDSFTFQLDTTPPIISLISPNESVEEGPQINFTWTVNEISNCSLFIDATFNASVSDFTGSTTAVVNGFTNNASHTWDVSCFDNGRNFAQSETLNFNATFQEPDVSQVFSFLEIGSCPLETQTNTLAFAFIGIFLLLVFVVVQIFMQEFAFMANILLGIGFCVFAVLLMGCSIVLGVPIFLWGILVISFKMFRE